MKLKRKTKVLFDTNILIDLTTLRTTNYPKTLLYKDVIKDYTISICSKQITDLYYIIRKDIPSIDIRKESIKEIIVTYKILNFKLIDIKRGLKLNGKDFEDNVLISVAKRNRIKMIITNNTKDFVNNENIKILSPNEFINLINN